MNLTVEMALVAGLVIALLALIAHQRWSKAVAAPGSLTFGTPATKNAWAQLFWAGLVTVLIAIVAHIGEEEKWLFTFVAVFILGGGWILLKRKILFAGHFVAATTTIQTALFGTLLAVGYLGTEAGGPPSPITNPLDPAQATVLRGYGAALDWSDSAHAVSDSQFMDSVVNGAPVPTNIIGSIRQPRNAHRRDQSDLEFGEGRIVFRFTITDAAGNPYPGGYHTSDLTNTQRLNLPAGVSYMFIDSLIMVTRYQGTARSFIIPANPQDSVRRGPPVVYYYHKENATSEGGFWYNRSFAKWYFRQGSGWTWGNCTSHGCCEI